MVDRKRDAVELGGLADIFEAGVNIGFWLMFRR